ncbi:uncharacterized protein LOC105790323 isoform X1 [Gossypium raimondii]|uniref:Uncharacterized protein n=2 Tax=Gossypium raimondii TaxID=29730 RepID=A0A0D2P414_GOSRA|nr:uncharacterized protein LOC105790323 isoform X1 [Gossypium raimondii]KJB21398.1 hypothetical protein B456_004G040300 [Gossypium raimondii]
MWPLFSDNWESWRSEDLNLSPYPFTVSTSLLELNHVFMIHECFKPFSCICKVYCCQKNCLQRRPKSRNSFSFVLPQLISPLPQLSASKLELLSLSVIDCLQGKKKSRSRMVLLRGKTWLCLLCLQWGKSRSVLSKTLVLSSFKFIYCKS